MPERKDEIVQALPSTIISGIPTAITAWFGTEHYLAPMDWFHDHVRGPKGEIIISSEAKLLSSLKSITRFWKADNSRAKVDVPGAKNLLNVSGGALNGSGSGNHIYNTGEIIDRIDYFAKEYGLTPEQEHLSAIRKEFADQLHETTEVASRSPLLARLRKCDSAFFQLFEDAIDPKYKSTTKAQMKIDADISKALRFLKRHNQSVINNVRVPATAIITGVVMAAVGKAHIEDERKEARLEEKLDYYHGKIDELEKNAQQETSSR